MPIMYVNPGPKKARKAARPKRKTKRKKISARRANMAKPKRRKKTTVRRKKKAPARRKPTSSTTRKAAAKKGAATRKRKAAARSRAAKKAARTRARRARRSNPVRRKRSAAPKRKRARKTEPKRRRARRNAPKRRRRTALAKRRSNPARKRRYQRRKRRAVKRRRNPATGGLWKFLMLKALPAAISLYGSRLLSGKLSGRIPGLDRLPSHIRQPAVALGVFGLGHVMTGKKSPIKMLKKYRDGVMVGTTINLLDKLIGAFAPESVKSMIGISNYDEDIYGPALDDYIQIGDVPPIQDDITFADYVAVDDYVQIGQYDTEGLEAELGMGMLEQDLGMLEQDLGMLQQDLGVEMDLGRADFADRNLGGVTRSAMTAPVGKKRYLAPVPPRSFTKPVPHFTAGFDKPANVYTGIFASGYGC